MIKVISAVSRCRGKPTGLFAIERSQGGCPYQRICNTGELGTCVRIGFGTAGFPLHACGNDGSR